MIELDSPVVAGMASAVAGGGITGVFVRWRLGRGDILLRFIAQQQEEMNALRKRVDELEKELRESLDREHAARLDAARHGMGAIATQTPVVVPVVVPSDVGGSVKSEGGRRAGDASEGESK